MIRQAQLTDLDRCFEIETVAYDGSEAATREKIAYRLEHYPEGFIVLETEGDVVGFINSAAADQVNMDSEDIKSLIGHHSDGAHVVVTSVAVHPGFQRKGYATQLMQAFVDRMERKGKQSLQLICQARLVPFYEQLGFSFVRVSNSNHGGLEWVEMKMPLAASSTISKEVSC